INNIPINYIEQPIKKMGEEAVEMLIEQIKGIKNIQQLVLDAEITHSIYNLIDHEDTIFYT
uniref:hypothetical protein n=1 Tax=unclassified Proteiniphilum TaxID=2622718 RepID=UPI00257BD8AE